MERQVLVLGIHKVLLERLVDRLHTEKRNWKEYRQVIISDDFHLRGVPRVEKDLKYLFDFFVLEDAQVVVVALCELVLNDSFDLSG